jgi:hypothetical protein
MLETISKIRAAIDEQMPTHPTFFLRSSYRTTSNPLDALDLQSEDGAAGALREADMVYARARAGSVAEGFGGWVERLNAEKNGGRICDD